MAGELQDMIESKPNTRQERRQQKELERTERIKDATQKKESVRKRRGQIRLIPIWLRLLIITVLVCLSILAGLMVGYGVIGDGKAADALKVSTWQHLVDLVLKDVSDK
ncbi:DNA-directed RNA polymerase subunit beta [Bacillus sp. Marseille-P3661]|uniref:DNA-directed RNA polymerase subunit beta n=1 Tax=Bacillus sp. Marseille-P3661 TaxID=1936234 RepID=UPI000C85F627|nr:DNA-directed RNA polymerase subunit beta [Bacillus sp. Marseille-P3661]